MLTVRVDYDKDAENPAANGDGQWTLYSFGRRHANYRVPADLGIGPPDRHGEPVIRDRVLRRKLKDGLAFLLSYFEHGQCLWFRRGTEESHPGVELRWDGVSVAGLLVWEHSAEDMGAKTYVDRAADADAFLRAYTAWANGDVLYYVIEDESGGVRDSCGGFYDAAHMAAEIRGILKGREFRLEGDAAGAISESDLRAPVQMERVKA